MKNLAIGWLVWLTEENMSRRLDMVKKSAKSLDVLKQDFYDLLAVKNAGVEKLPFELPSNLQVIDLSRNYFDISVQLIAYIHALENNYKYFAFLYDDFVVYKDPFKDCIDFMDKNDHIDCMRLPEYFTNNSYYDSDITSKRINPDAVRHYDGAGESIRRTKLIQTGPVQIGNNQFYFSNWRPISRPMLWRTKSYSKFVDMKENHQPIMQTYEAKIFKIADKLAVEGEYKSSYLEGGMCKTFSVETSERTRGNRSDIESRSINMNDLYEEYMRSYKR